MNTQTQLFEMTDEEREQWHSERMCREGEKQAARDWREYKVRKPVENEKHRAKMQAEFEQWAKGGIFDPHECSCWLIGGTEKIPGQYWP